MTGRDGKGEDKEMKRQGKEKLRRSGQGRKEGKETGWKEDIRLCLTSPMTHIESDLLTL